MFDVLFFASLESIPMVHGEVNHTGGEPIDRWLRRLLFFAATVFVACCCWFMWRMSMVAYHTERAVVAISDDLKQMSATGVQISEHLQDVDQRLQRMEAKASDAMNLDEAEHLLDQAILLRDAREADSPERTADTEREIKHLLSQIRQSKHRFVSGDDDRGGMRTYLQLYAKYKVYDDTIANAEDFIAKVATTSVAGRPYQVVISEAETVSLNEWLTKELVAFRASSTEQAGGARLEAVRTETGD